MYDRDPTAGPGVSSPERVPPARTDAGVGPADVWRMLRRVVDALPEEGMLCSAIGRVIHANAAARRWLASARHAQPLRDAVALACAALRRGEPGSPPRGDEPATPRACHAITLGGVAMELRAIDLGGESHDVVPGVLVLLRAEWPLQPARTVGLSSRLACSVRLTPCEREIARLLAMRRTDGEIASTLGISVRTVQSHVQHIFGKLGVHSRRAVGPALAALRDTLAAPVPATGATQA